MSKEEEKKIITLKLDQAELAVRIVEAMTDTARPEGRTPEECLEDISEEGRQSALNAAFAAATYFVEVMKGEIPNVTSEKIKKSDGRWSN